MTLTEPSVLITGATGRLGRIFALGFARMGGRVALTSRNPESGRALERECLQCGARRAIWIGADLTASDAASVIVRELSKADMRPEVLVNNARDGKHLTVESDGSVSRSNWEKEMLLGVILPYELTMAIANSPGSLLRSVINIASIYGITVPNSALYENPERDSSVNYGVTKAALIQLTKELAVRLASRNIKVNAVSYGGVAGRATEAFQKRYARLSPVGKMLDETEVFGAIRFLSSGESSGMTGHNLVVDGGWTIW